MFLGLEVAPALLPPINYGLPLRYRVGLDLDIPRRVVGRASARWLFDHRSRDSSFAVFAIASSTAR